MDVLTGVLVDVSGSMKGTNDGDSGGGSWARSIFKFIDRLITYDASSDHRVFAVGFGASCQPETFDVLTTLKSLKPVENRGKRNMLEEAVRIIETNGAPRIRKWTTVDELDPHLGEWETSVLLYALENKPDFRYKFIYDCLPESCREVGNVVAEAANWTASWFPKVHQDMTSSKVGNVIEEGMNLVKNYFLAEVTREAAYCVKEASETLHGAVGKERNSFNELYKRLEPFIYGGTPLMKSLRQAVDLFREYHQYKLLFILSDGDPSDGIYPPSRQLADLGVTVVCCYITQRPIAEPRRLYSSERSEWEQAAKFMFRMSSSIPTQKIPRTVFVKKDWKIDIDNNKTYMFFQINNPAIIKEVCDLAKDCVCSQDTLADILSSVSLDIYINKANEGIQPDQQNEKTCYAVASAAVMHLAVKRIVGRQGGYPDFRVIRDELINMYGVKGAIVGNVLREVCPKYRLRYQKTDKRGALNAVVEKRPVVAIFQLSGEEWDEFHAFYRRSPRGILRKSDLQVTSTRSQRGHAVVLTSFNSESLRLMNSKGSNWADGGFFRVQNAAVLGLMFYDIFWNEEDLLPSEKEALDRHGADISAKLMKSLTSLQTATYKCPLCSVESKVSEFKGHLLEAQCPVCGGKFNAGNEAESDLALNIYLTSLSSSA